MQQHVTPSPQPHQKQTVVSARLAALQVEQTKVHYLEQENARLRAELEEERARNRKFTEGVHGDLRTSHAQHITSLEKHNQQITASTSMIIDTLLQHYGARLLPRQLHNLPRWTPQAIQQSAQRSFVPKTNLYVQQEWQQHLALTEQHLQQERQQTIRKAIVEELNEKVTSGQEGAKRLEELNLALVDCEKNAPLALPAPSSGSSEGKVEVMKDMVGMLKLEREILVQGLPSIIAKEQQQRSR